MQTHQRLIKNNRPSIKERLAIARDKLRPKGVDIVNHITSSFQQLHGDRLFGDDPAVVCGVGEIEKKRCVFIVQQKGSDAKERVNHNFGMMSPHGYRKALRMMKLAERFNLPVITIIDTPGAYPGLDAEKMGQGVAIADNLFELSQIKTPIISLLLGEGCSGGALGVGICDKMYMLENAYFSVISPEGCSSILWKDPKKSDFAARQLKMQAENLLEFGMIDGIIQEGDGGFHKNLDKVLLLIKDKLQEAIEELSLLSLSAVIDKRYKKYRSF